MMIEVAFPLFYKSRACHGKAAELILAVSWTTKNPLRNINFTIFGFEFVGFPDNTYLGTKHPLASAICSRLKLAEY
jgi:hypothetical protein